MDNGDNSASGQFYADNLALDNLASQNFWLGQFGQINIFQQFFLFLFFQSFYLSFLGFNE